MTKDGDAPLEHLMQVLGHSFGDPDLLRTALTHPSALTRRTGRQGPRQKGGQDNQRLEFLGDRVLGLVVAEMLFRTFGEEDEGAMANRLAALVRQEGLAHVARSIDLGSHLILSRGEEEGGGRDNAATLADACEALIGAIYLDAGLEAARQFVERHWRSGRRGSSRRRMPRRRCRNGPRPPACRCRSIRWWNRAARRTIRPSPSRSRSPARHRQARGKSKRSAEQAAAASLMADCARDRRQVALRLCRPYRRAECRQVDPAQPPDRREGLDRQPQGADHAPACSASPCAARAGVFVDTPGIFAPRRRLDRAMVAAAWGGAGDADASS